MPVMDCIAHRGFGAVNPENTLAAVESAVAAGADTIELDIRRCGSDDLVVVHDETVDRVTGASGAVSELSAVTLQDLSVLDSGEGVPRLGAVCRATPPDVRLNLELKERGIATETVGTARQHGHEPILSSQSTAALAEVESVPRGYVFHDEPERNLRVAADLACTAVHPHWQLCTEPFLAAARERDLAVRAWTVTEQTVATDLTSAGVDGLIADAPAYCGAGRDSGP
jgi:glycerophosphoryl diester phosphodiesterase